MLKRHSILVALLVVIVSGPGIVHANGQSPRSLASASKTYTNGLSKDRELERLKKNHDCIRAAITSRTHALDAGWQTHQTARGNADIVNRVTLATADEAFRSCARDKASCKAERQVARKKAHGDLETARAFARQAWKEERKKAGADYKAAKEACR